LHTMSDQKQQFGFDSLVYSGFDFPEDGIGNHLSLLDRLIFNQPELTNKSFCEVLSHPDMADSYGRVPPFDHLVHAENYHGTMYLDVSRDMYSPDLIELQRRRALDFKKYYGAVTAIYLFWESSRLWEGIIGLLKAYDFCVVTADFIVPELKYYGVDHVLLDHPYDFTTIDPNTLQFEIRPDVLRFGISSGLWRRKNVALLAEKFVERFGNSERHVLSIHTRFDPKKGEDHIDDFKRISNLLDTYENVEFVNKRFTRSEYLDWLKSLNVYCFPSSGEGYSITPREALHLGKPVVLSNAHVHKQLCELPGVIPVASQGMRKATPSTVTFDIDIGSEWVTDRQSLSDGLVRADEHYLELVKSISKHYESITRAHDPERIKRQWIEALNDRYRYYSNRHQSPVSASDIFLSEWKTHFTPRYFEVQHAGFSHDTGEVIGDKLYCYVQQHEPGHCLYGPDYKILITRKYIVEFYIRFLSVGDPDRDQQMVSLDIYDQKSEKIIAFHDVIVTEPSASTDKYELGFEGKRDQVLEFRVYWHKTCDIEVSRVILRPI